MAANAVLCITQQAGDEVLGHRGYPRLHMSQGQQALHRTAVQQNCKLENLHVAACRSPVLLSQSKVLSCLGLAEGYTASTCGRDMGVLSASWSTLDLPWINNQAQGSIAQH